MAAALILPGFYIFETLVHYRVAATISSEELGRLLEDYATIREQAHCTDTQERLVNKKWEADNKRFGINADKVFDNPCFGPLRGQSHFFPLLSKLEAIDKAQIFTGQKNIHKTLAEICFSALAFALVATSLATTSVYRLVNRFNFRPPGLPTFPVRWKALANYESWLLSNRPHDWAFMTHRAAALLILFGLASASSAFYVRFSDIDKSNFILHFYLAVAPALLYGIWALARASKYKFRITDGSFLRSLSKVLVLFFLLAVLAAASAYFQNSESKNAWKNLAAVVIVVAACQSMFVASAILFPALMSPAIAIIVWFSVFSVVFPTFVALGSSYFSLGFWIASCVICAIPWKRQLIVERCIVPLAAMTLMFTPVIVVVFFIGFLEDDLKRTPFDSGVGISLLICFFLFFARYTALRLLLQRRSWPTST